MVEVILHFSVMGGNGDSGGVGGVSVRGWGVGGRG